MDQDEILAVDNWRPIFFYLDVISLQVKFIKVDLVEI